MPHRRFTYIRMACTGLYQASKPSYSPGAGTWTGGVSIRFLFYVVVADYFYKIHLAFTDYKSL